MSTNTYHISPGTERRRSSSHELEEMNDYKKEMVETSDEEDIEGDDEVNEITSHVFCDSEQENDNNSLLYTDFDVVS